jgi:hypothetical protein
VKLKSNFSPVTLLATHGASKGVQVQLEPVSKSKLTSVGELVSHRTISCGLMPAKARENRHTKTRRWSRLHGRMVAAAVTMAASKSRERERGSREGGTAFEGDEREAEEREVNTQGQLFPLRHQ